MFEFYNTLLMLIYVDFSFQYENSMDDYLNFKLKKTFKDL
jgi:hypothetical protein